ncbi:TPA: AAA family ATPase [Stenotrophomonas maltophilia]|uniref:KAP family P-loop NTPase fold protein n=1 Tax=Stenotrophomonas maltophilia TaxID=40324 RepID=UPI002A9A3BE7|nr:P-loop NTPase fold protein [Stenotrophomonas maltophilia]HEL4856637.1 AAA family ATPase [Stenotrophomonas maltophilia]HEL7632396.1 AAA family ATPase [Stenotrophomonas maltophilia]HEL7636256.1 AAA family ATPase [Stenotrophomonas maltophilia]
MVVETLAADERWHQNEASQARPMVMFLSKLQQHTPTNEDIWGDDPLGRRECAVTLTRLIRATTKPYVIGIYGPWGSGKTVFMHQLQLELEQEKVPTVRVDAWRTDYLADPLVALVEAINQRQADEAAAHGGGLTRSPDELLEASLAIALPLSEIGVAATAVATPLLAATGAALKGALVAAKEVVSRRVKASKDLRIGIEHARDYLTGRARPGVVSPIVKPLVIVIDELDRCRPDYAVRMLERVKHFFDVNGIVFLIASDGKNLPAAVNSQYGSGLNSEEYLRKFFDYEYVLPEPNALQFTGVLFQSFGWDRIVPEGNMLFDQGFGSREQIASYVHGIQSFDRRYDYSEALDLFPKVADWLDLKLRDQAQAFTLIDVYLRTREPEEVAFPQLSVFLACMRFGREKKYREIIKNPTSQSFLGQMDFERPESSGLKPLRDWVTALASWDRPSQQKSSVIVNNAREYGSVDEPELLPIHARLRKLSNIGLSDVISSFSRLARA